MREVFIDDLVVLLKESHEIAQKVCLVLRRLLVGHGDQPGHPEQALGVLGLLHEVLGHLDGVCLVAEDLTSVTPGDLGGLSVQHNRQRHADQGDADFDGIALEKVLAYEWEPLCSLKDLLGVEAFDEGRIIAGTVLSKPSLTISPLLMVKATRMSFHRSSGFVVFSGTR